MTILAEENHREESAAPPRLAEIITNASRAYGTVGEMTYAVLHEAILDGTLPNGTKLRQEPLASAIGVSRIPVRSALMQLEADGLVEFIPRRGAHVRSLTPDTVEQIFDSRILLERHALHRSMEGMTAERAGRVAQLATQLDGPHPSEGFRDELIEFYHVLYDAAGQPVLTELIDRLRDKVGRQLVAKPMHHSEYTHRSLVSPVISGDIDAALTRLENHLLAVKEGILAHIG